jgi:membrane protease YdiL (CAAX protease family)
MRIKKTIENNKALAFFTLTILIGWSPWITGNGYVLFAALTIVALLLARTIEGKKGVNEIIQRLSTWRTSPKLYAYAILTPALAYTGAIVINILLGGVMPTFQLLKNPVMALITFIMFLLPWQSSAFLEEVGFRGYILANLQEKNGPLKGTLILGVFFGAWLLPEFYRTGSAQQLLGLGYYPWFILTEIGFSIVMTWLYNRSGKSSLLSGVLFHTAMNFWSYVLLTNNVPGQTMTELDIMLWKLASIAVLISGLIVAWSTKGTLGGSSEK